MTVCKWNVIKVKLLREEQGNRKIMIKKQGKRELVIEEQGNGELLLEELKVEVSECT